MSLSRLARDVLVQLANDFLSNQEAVNLAQTSRAHLKDLKEKYRWKGWWFRPSGATPKRVGQPIQAYVATVEELLQVPLGVRELEIHGNQSLTDVPWVRSIRSIDLPYFNQPIDRVQWPDSLTRLSLGTWFNQLIDRVQWPDSLAYLEFGHAFNRPIDQVRWPPSLTYLKFGFRFNHPIDQVQWPESLTVIMFGFFNQSLQRVKWPPSLRSVEFWNPGMRQHLEETSWPDSLQTLVLRFDPIPIPRRAIEPPSKRVRTV